MKRIPTPYLFIAVILMLCLLALILYKSASEAMSKYAAYQNISSDSTAEAQQALQLQKQIDQDNATAIALSTQQKGLLKQRNAIQYVENGLGYNIHSSYDASNNTYDFTDTIGKQPNNGAYEHTGKQAIFNIELTMWLSSLHPDAVHVYVLDPSGVTLLTATVHKATASRLDWSDLNPDSAWNAYDTTFISPSLSN